MPSGVVMDTSYLMAIVHAEPVVRTKKTMYVAASEEAANTDVGIRDSYDGCNVFSMLRHILHVTSRGYQPYWQGRRYMMACRGRSR